MFPGESWQLPALPQVEVTVPDSPEPGTNLGFEPDLSSSSCHRIRKLVSQPIGNTVRGDQVLVPSQTQNLELDQILDKWCLKNLTGSKSVDHQLETTVIETGGGCLRGVTRVRRDSVGASSGSGSSPGSAVTSPRRWAAKPEQISEAEPSIHPVTSTCHTGNRSVTCPRSCSADHLGAIVDILGVPTGAPQLWDNPRRLILSAEKKKIEMKR